MAGLQVVATLSNKYAHLLGELAIVERMVEDADGLQAMDEATKECGLRKKQISDQLIAIETVIWLFDSEFDPASIKPIRPRFPLLPYGTVAKGMYGILRETNAPLTVRELAKGVAAIHYGTDLDEETLSKIEKAVNTLLGSHRDLTGAKQIHRVSRNPDRWSLTARLPDLA